LGRYLTDALQKEGAFLRISDFRKPIWEIKEIDFCETDIRDKDKIDALCQDIEIIFHLAAMPSIARGKASDYYEVNVKGTLNVLEASLKHKIKKIVHVSSSTVYGIPQEFPLKESSLTHPIGKYGRSKLEAEELCQEFIKRGLDISIIRPRVIIGPGRIGIFSILFDRIQNNRPVYIIGKGRNVFQFTNVFDMVSACIKAAELQGSDLFNIGSDNVLSVQDELMALIRHVKSKSWIIRLPASLARLALRVLSFFKLAPLVDEQFMIADINFKLDTMHAHKKLDWHPVYSNVDSLIQAYDWYVANVNKRQYKALLGVIGRFKDSKMGGFQNN